MLCHMQLFHKTCIILQFADVGDGLAQLLLERKVALDVCHIQTGPLSSIVTAIPCIILHKLHMISPVSGEAPLLTGLQEKHASQHVNAAPDNGQEVANRQTWNPYKLKHDSLRAHSPPSLQKLPQASG